MKVPMNLNFKDWIRISRANLFVGMLLGVLPGSRMLQAQWLPEIRIGGVPFGPFHLPEQEFGKTFTLSMRASKSPENALQILTAAREHKMKIIIHLAGSRQEHQNEDHSFSLEKFKELLDGFKDVDFDSFVKDGTLLGHLMYDEPHDPSNWDGKPVPYPLIDAAAAESKKLWPTLPVGVAGPLTFLVKGAPYKYLEMGLSQYITKRGEVKQYAEKEVEAVKQAGLKLVFSMNVLGPGGSTGKEGRGRKSGDERVKDVDAGAMRMRPDQLKEFGSVLLSQPGVIGLLMWKYDEDYFGQKDIHEAMEEIARVARNNTGK